MAVTCTLHRWVKYNTCNIESHYYIFARWVRGRETVQIMQLIHWRKIGLSLLGYASLVATFLKLLVANGVWYEVQFRHSLEPVPGPSPSPFVGCLQRLKTGGHGVVTPIHAVLTAKTWHLDLKEGVESLRILHVLWGQRTKCVCSQ